MLYYNIFYIKKISVKIINNSDPPPPRPSLCTDFFAGFLRLISAPDLSFNPSR